MNELLLAMNAMPENITINDLQINKGKDKEVLHHIDTVYDKAGDKKYEICVVGMGGAGTIAALVLEKSGMTKVTGIVRSKYTVVEKEGIRIESVDHGIIESWKPTRSE
jgi:tRNA A37 threonylcarbamoyladenosine dehydratase